MLTTTTNRIVRVWNAISDDLVRFTRSVLRFQCWSKQAEIIESVYAPEESGTVKAPVLAILYDEIAQAQAQQFSQIDRLNERAQQLFGFVAVILTIIVAAATEDITTAMKIGLGGLGVLAVLVALCATRAWRLEDWSGDPDVGALWKNYRGKAEETFRYQVIANRLASIRKNDQQIVAKIQKVKWAYFWLNCGFVYTVALVVFLLLQ